MHVYIIEPKTGPPLMVGFHGTDRDEMERLEEMRDRMADEGRPARGFGGFDAIYQLRDGAWEPLVIDDTGLWPRGPSAVRELLRDDLPRYPGGELLSNL